MPGHFFSLNGVRLRAPHNTNIGKRVPSMSMSEVSSADFTGAPTLQLLLVSKMLK